MGCSFIFFLNWLLVRFDHFLLHCFSFFYVFIVFCYVFIFSRYNNFIYCTKNSCFYIVIFIDFFMIYDLCDLRNASYIKVINIYIYLNFNSISSIKVLLSSHFGHQSPRIYFIYCKRY